MAEPVTLDQLKKQLQILPADTEEDEFLGSLILAARRACEKRTGASVASEAPTLTDPADLAVFSQAVKMLAAHWYTNREAFVPGQTVAAEMPLAVQWLLDPYRVLVV
jgi:hypothetical protein